MTSPLQKLNVLVIKPANNYVLEFKCENLNTGNISPRFINNEELNINFIDIINNFKDSVSCNIFIFDDYRELMSIEEIISYHKIDLIIHEKSQHNFINNYHIQLPKLLLSDYLLRTSDTADFGNIRAEFDYIPTNNYFDRSILLTMNNIVKKGNIQGVIRVSYACHSVCKDTDYNQFYQIINNIIDLNLSAYYIKGKTKFYKSDFINLIHKENYVYLKTDFDGHLERGCIIYI